MINQSLIPTFWPSHRLWLKFLIGFIYMPFLFSLVFWTFILFSFSSTSEQGLYLILFFLLLVGGPISIGLMLTPSRRGLGAGLITVVTTPVIWYFASVAYDNGYLTDNLQLGIVTASMVILLELVSGDVRQRRELIGLGIGLITGLLLVIANTALVGTYFDTGNDVLTFLSFFPPISLVWLSTLFFPEWLSHKVSLGGIIVWIGLILIVFGLSLLLKR